MRPIPPRAQRILDQLRADAAPKFRGSLQPAAAQRREAAAFLRRRPYLGKPVEIGADLAARLRS